MTNSSAPPSTVSGRSDVSLTRSASLFARAETMIPAGVSSPVRAFRKVGGTPGCSRRRVARTWSTKTQPLSRLLHGLGSVDSWHAHPKVVEAVQRAAADGLAFGTAHRQKANSPSACSPRTATRRWSASS